MPNIYDLEEAFKKIEDDLTNDIINGIKKTTTNDILENNHITIWRTNQLKELQRFKKENAKYFTKNREKELKSQISEVLTQTYENAGSKQQKTILKAIENGLKTKNEIPDDEIIANFSGLNDRKLKALIKETSNNLYKAQTSAVRYAEDQYKQIIFNSNVYFNTGNGTLTKCIDMATKDFLSAGINNIEYKNGHRVNIQSYAEMALRTAEKRSYIQGEAAMRDEYGLGLVIVNRRGNACPHCMQFVGKVFNDDVYGNAKIDKRYPLLSEAIKGGLYHPNCKDVHTTYFPGITTKYPAPTKEDLKKANEQYELEQIQRYNERNIRKYKRLADGTLDAEEAEKYNKKIKEWQARQRKLIDDHPTLTRKYSRESVVSNVEPSKKVFEAEKPKKIVYKNFKSGEAADEFFLNNKEYEDWYENLTNDEKEAINHYTGNGYRDINDILRGKYTPNEHLLKQNNERIKLIDEAIDNFELTENIVTYRGAYMDVFKDLEDFGYIDDQSFEILKKHKGEIFNDKAFLSSSLDKEVVNQGFNKPLKFEIKIPKGKGRGMYVEKLTYNEKEYEFLIKQNSNFLITDIQLDEDNNAIIKMKLLGD